MSLRSIRSNGSLFQLFKPFNQAGQIYNHFLLLVEKVRGHCRKYSFEMGVLRNGFGHSGAGLDGAAFFDFEVADQARMKSDRDSLPDLCAS